MSESGSVSIGDRDKQDTYSHRDSTAATNVMAERTANEHAAFLLPHLQQGMRLLDAGCGPGTITLDLAKWVAPGEVVGIDRGPEQIEAARQRAVQQQSEQVRFEVADICALPFPDNSFDVAYCNGVLAHLQHPEQAVRELHRVLKPGGVAGIRNGANQGFLIAPPSPLVLRFLSLYIELVKSNGGSPYVGQTQHALLRQAGFVRRVVTASFECVADPTQSRMKVPAATVWALEASFGGKLVELGLTNWEELHQIVDAWRAWEEHPDSFMAIPWCEVVGWKA